MGEPRSESLDRSDAEDPRWSLDRELARRCAAGDRASQRLLYEREKRRAHATLYRIFGSNRHVEDVIQDVFLQVFRSIPTFRGESSLSTWIHRTTVRVAFAHLSQGKKRRPDLELVHDVPSEGPTLDETAHARDGARRLYRVLETLEPKQRLAFVLHEIEGNSMAEVASAMEASLVATKTRVFRARLRIVDAAKRDPVLTTFLEEDVSRESVESGA